MADAELSGLLRSLQIDPAAEEVVDKDRYITGCERIMEMMRGAMSTNKQLQSCCAASVDMSLPYVVDHAKMQEVVGAEQRMRSELLSAYENSLVEQQHYLDLMHAQFTPQVAAAWATATQEDVDNKGRMWQRMIDASDASSEFFKRQLRDFYTPT